MIVLLLFGIDLVQGRVETKGEVWVGQRVTLVVTLYSPTFFAGAAAFDLPTVPGVVLLPPQGRPLVGSETIGEDTYTTQTHELAAYPQRAGTVRLPPIRVRFASDGGIGKPAVPRAGATKELTFTAKMPPGAEGLSTVLATPELSLREAWKPEPGKAKVGGAFTRTVTVRAAGVPGMVLPPMRWDAPEGVRVYPAPASVTDASERGESSGQRVESATFVCERAGTFRLPGVTLAWWDPAGKQLHRARLPSRTIEVEPGPATEPTPPPRTSIGAAWGVAVLGLALVLLFLWLRPWSESKSEEAAAFARACEACRTGDPRRIEGALLAWLDRVPNDGRPWRLEDLTGRSADPSLTARLEELQGVLYRREGESRGGFGVGLDRLLPHVREVLMGRGRGTAAEEALPGLNP